MTCRWPEISNYIYFGVLVKSGPVCALDGRCWHADEQLSVAQIEGLEVLYGACLRVNAESVPRVPQGNLIEEDLPSHAGLPL
jgi:hypothetical protein